LSVGVAEAARLARLCRGRSRADHEVVLAQLGDEQPARPTVCAGRRRR
jgi:hypothetical protein